MAIRTIADPRRPDPEAVAQAVRTLLNGELVVVPTETVYGVAADPRVPGAVERIYRAKQRPPGKEIAFLIDRDGWRSTPAIADHPAARRLAERFWPGPLTLVVAEGDAWTGYRVPAHEVTLAVLRGLGHRIAATSANRSGRPDPRTAQEAAAELGDQVALILDAGPAPGGVASTVVRVRQHDLEVLRPGALSVAQITRAAGIPVR